MVILYVHLHKTYALNKIKCENFAQLMHPRHWRGFRDLSLETTFERWKIICTVRGVRCTTIVYPKKYAHGFCFAVLCCGYTLTDFPISIRLTSLALWQSNDCPSASKATLMNMDKYFMWIHYARLHNHNKAKHNKTVCIFIGIYCRCHDIFSYAFVYCLSPCVP